VLSALLASPHPNDSGKSAPNANDNVCPRDMRLVEGTHVDRAVHNVCTQIKFGTCVGFEKGNVTLTGPRVPIRACMDTFEAPNVQGSRPFVMKSGDEAEAWCSERGKRLCTEFEWETACEGDDHAPFGYGWSADETCNTQKPWKAFNSPAAEERRRSRPSACGKAIGPASGPAASPSTACAICWATRRSG
jgi:hypothetical protein